MAKDTQNSEIEDDEPSIEEILSSIRDIISDDEEEGEENDVAEEEAKPAETETVEATDAGADDDVLDLTDVVTDDDLGKDVPKDDNMAEEDTSAIDDNDPLAGINLDHPGDDFDISDAPIEAASQTEEESDDGLADILGADAGDDTPEPIAEDPKPQAAKPMVDEDALLNDVTAQATVSSMSKLAQNIAISRNAQGSNVTLDDIVRDLLRPMLKDWLDENLPDVIERLVAKELERLAEKAARK